MIPVHAGRKSGFTIVEIMVVIAVIGILATIGIVSYSGSQNRAKRESFNSTAQQVKLKLGEYYTDNARYPRAKTGTDSVVNYLNASGNGSLATEFATSPYVYTPTPSGCTTACTGYAITVARTNWNGGSSEPPIDVRP